MKIEIQSACWSSIEEMIRRYPQLCDFHFEIEKKVEPRFIDIKDERGKDHSFECGCSYGYTPYIHIDTIEDLFKLGQAVDKNLVIHDDQTLIVIYDTYLE